MGADNTFGETNFNPDSKKTLIDSILTITDDPRRDYASDEEVTKKLESLLKSNAKPYYQLCPKCLGEGMVSNIGSSSSLFRDCPVCNGAKILLINSKPDMELIKKVAIALLSHYGNNDEYYDSAGNIFEDWLTTEEAKQILK